MSIVDKRAEVPRLIFEVNKVLRHCMRKSFEDIGVTAPQTMVIGTLLKNGEMKISELSKTVGLSNSTISGIIDRLEKQELVIRTRSSEDRRTVYVKVAKRVEEMHEGIHREINKRFQDLLSAGTDEDMEKIIDGLNTLKKILNKDGDGSQTN